MKIKFWLLVIFMLTGCVSSPNVDKVKFRSWQDMLEGNVVMQGQDFSCGAAALATMLNYYFGQEVSEQAIIDSIIAESSEAEIEILKTKGFSFTQLRDEAVRRGFKTEIDTFPLDRIHKFPIPMIVYVEKHGFKHFAVLKGVRNGEAFIADPSRGNLQLHFDEFVKEWKNSANPEESYMGLSLEKKGEMLLTKGHPLEISDEMLLHPEYGAARRALFRP